jgi:hypothetical protein
MAIRTITLGSLVAFLSSFIGIIYVYLYYQLFDFSSYLPLWKVPAILTFLSFLLVGFSIVMNKLFKRNGNFVTSFLVTLFSVISISIPTLFPPRFPEEIEVPEMFPGFILPLHFLVPLFWLFLSPQYLIKS